jgi:hypothetical protein
MLMGTAVTWHHVVSIYSQRLMDHSRQEKWKKWGTLGCFVFAQKKRDRGRWQNDQGKCPILMKREITPPWDMLRPCLWC